MGLADTADLLHTLAMNPRRRLIPPAGIIWALILFAIGAPHADGGEFGALDEASQAAESLAGQSRERGRLSAAAQAGGPSEGRKTLSSADICGADGAATQEAREKRLRRGLSSIEAEIRPRIAVLAEKYGLAAPSGDLYLERVLTSISFTYPYKTDMAKEAVSAISEAVEQAVLKRSPLPDYARIKARLIARIQAQASLSPDARAALIRRVELTALVLPSQYVRDYVTTAGELWPLLNQITADQAWNASYDDLGGADNPALARDQSVLIVFPGLLLAETGGAAVAPHLDFILAHETAHSIDSDRFPGLYARQIECMKRSYKQEFKAWDEVVADYWSAAAVAGLVPRTTSRDGRLDYLRKSYEIICASSGEAGSILMSIKGMISADHPSGEYRIDNILGRDPEIAQSLGTRGRDAASCQP